MKVRINKALLAQLPQPLRQVVEEFRWRRVSTISIEHTKTVHCEEDARYTAFSPDFDRVQHERSSGEWAGLTRLSPTANIALPPGCTIVAQGYFLGKPFLDIFHNPEGGAKLALAIGTTPSLE